MVGEALILGIAANRGGGWECDKCDGRGKADPYLRNFAALVPDSRRVSSLNPVARLFHRHILVFRVFKTPLSTQYSCAPNAGFN